MSGDLERLALTPDVTGGAMVTWLRRQVIYDRDAAQLLIEDPEVADRWTERSTGVLEAGSDRALDAWQYTWAVGDGRVSRHVARHGPLDVVADCEAKLRLLDEHYILWRHDAGEAYEEFSVARIGGANQDHGCVTCHYYSQGGVKGLGYCRTVRLLAWGYRHRDGYREQEWAP